jgi:hypothetical protein
MENLYQLYAFSVLLKARLWIVTTPISTMPILARRIGLIIFARTQLSIAKLPSGPTMRLSKMSCLIWRLSARRSPKTSKIIKQKRGTRKIQTSLRGHRSKHGHPSAVSCQRAVNHRFDLGPLHGHLRFSNGRHPQLQIWRLRWPAAADVWRAVRLELLGLPPYVRMRWISGDGGDTWPIGRGQNRLPPYRAVQIEKGLRAESPENGNIPQVGWRLSAISREGCHFSGRGDAAQNARKPVFSGLFVI